MNLLEMNNEIYQEANLILYQHGLLTTLEKFGKVMITGSYALDLMTWRDLDIYIDNKNLSEKEFFTLGYEISSALQPNKMVFRNELIGKTPGLPVGFYWGVHTNLMEWPWKIDIWAVDSNQIQSFNEFLNEMKSKLTEENRIAILEIKAQVCNLPEYRKKLKSIDVYQAVLEDGVKNINEFTEWLNKFKGLTIHSG